MNSHKNQYEDYYDYESNIGTYNDPFMGYQLQEDEEYYEWEKQIIDNGEQTKMGP